jgi:predicted NAD/FAD-dependent oxidoreductase
VDKGKPDEAVVVGGGFIGLEMAENLHSRGIKVTIVEAAGQVMAPIDYEMACIVHRHILSKGLKLYLKDGVKAFHREEKRIKVELQGGKLLAADMVILAIHFGRTVYDLEELELAYSPPYSSAKDPVNMAGYVAANCLKGDMEVIHWDQVDRLDRDKVFILDVRPPEEASTSGYRLYQAVKQAEEVLK